jgi:predicted SnoaL-like aldol condensation-catalyzing enzyme
LSSKFVNVTESAHKVLGQGNFVLMMSEGLFDGKPTAFYDLYRLEEGKQVEHWDVLDNDPPPAVGYTDYPLVKPEPAGTAVGRGTE